MEHSLLETKVAFYTLLQEDRSRKIIVYMKACFDTLEGEH